MLLHTVTEESMAPINYPDAAYYYDRAVEHRRMYPDG